MTLRDNVTLSGGQSGDTKAAFVPVGATSLTSIVTTIAPRRGRSPAFAVVLALLTCADVRERTGANPRRLGAKGPTNPGVGDARRLRFPVACGYTLAEIEWQIVDAAEQPTAGPSSGAT